MGEAKCRRGFSRSKKPDFCSRPATKPIMPQQNICHGVHGPCPNIKLETNAVSAPVIKPASGPNATAVIITIADTGLKLGSGIS